MQPPFLVKTPHKQSYAQTIHKLHRLWTYIYQHIKFNIQDIKHLSEITPGVIPTVERGAHFHPTVGSTTPNGFTTSQPRAETTMLRDCVSVCQWPRTKVTLLLLCCHSLCVFPEFPFFLPSHLPPHPTLLLPFFPFGEVVCGTIFLTVVRSEDSTNGRFTPIPHYSWGSLYLTT